VTEGEITLAASAVGLVAVPFAWKWVFARPVAPLPELRTEADRSWPLPLAFSLFVLQFAVLGLTVKMAAGSPILVRSLLAGAVAVTALVAWFLAPRLLKPSLRVPAAFGAGLLTMLAALPFVYGIHFLQSLFVNLDVKQDAVRRIQEREAGWKELALAAMVLAPLIEELVFRVFIYGGLRRTFRLRGAMLLSAALFGAIHFLPPTTILPMFVFGLILARLMERTGSYVACVTAHAAFNIFGVAAALAV
jgi:membrane protease YdiL (CAAX protease family)